MSTYLLSGGIFRTATLIAVSVLNLTVKKIMIWEGANSIVQRVIQEGKRL